MASSECRNKVLLCQGSFNFHAFTPRMKHNQSWTVVVEVGIINVCWLKLFMSSSNYRSFDVVLRTDRPQKSYSDRLTDRPTLRQNLRWGYSKHEIFYEWPKQKVHSWVWTKFMMRKFYKNKRTLHLGNLSISLKLVISKLL